MLLRPLIFLISAFSLPNALAQIDTDWAVVLQGAFVIPSSDLPWTDPEGRAAGKRIGYMRIGTVVKVGACAHVNASTAEHTGTYCNIQSEVGVEGKALAKLLFPLEPAHTYAIARSEVLLYDRNDPTRTRESFSRNFGTIIEVKGDWLGQPNSAMVDVYAIYNRDKPGALTDLAINMLDLTEKTFLIDVPADPGLPPSKYENSRDNLGNVILAGEPVAVWSIKPATAATANQLAAKVLRDLGWNDDVNDNAVNLIQTAFEVTATTLDKIQCAASLNAEISTGIEFLGNGLKLAGRIPVFNQGKLFDFDIDVVEREQVAQFWLLTTKTVACELGANLVDTEPRFVERATVFAFRNSPPDGSPTRLQKTDIELYNLVATSALDSQNLPRLFRISQFPEYIEARRFIIDQVTNSDLNDQLNRQERRVLQHAMIAKLADFRKPASQDDLD